MLTAKYEVGMRFDTTAAILENGRIKRIPAVGIITKVMREPKFDIDRTGTASYAADINGLEQTFNENEIQAGF